MVLWGKIVKKKNHPALLSKNMSPCVPCLIIIHQAGANCSLKAPQSQNANKVKVNQKEAPFRRSFGRIKLSFGVNSFCCFELLIFFHQTKVASRSSGGGGPRGLAPTWTVATLRLKLGLSSNRLRTAADLVIPLLPAVASCCLDGSCSSNYQ